VETPLHKRRTFVSRKSNSGGSILTFWSANSSYWAWWTIDSSHDGGRRGTRSHDWIWTRFLIIIPLLGERLK
jgi:hypothetical protein